MEKQNNRVKAITLKANIKGEIEWGCPAEVLAEELLKLPRNKRGWVNGIIKPNFRPSNQGYTHVMLFSHSEEKIDGAAAE